jgi:hypothetical protein
LGNGGGRLRSTESRSPPLFAPLLEVERDIAHHPNSGFTVPALSDLNARGALKVLAKLGLSERIKSPVWLQAACLITRPQEE